MKHNYEAVYYDGEPNERLAEYHVVKWQLTSGASKLGKKIATFGTSHEAVALANALNKNPIWIVVDGGETFEGHQGHWADCCFSNATESAIRFALDDGEIFQCERCVYEIREMTDEEVAKYPEALEFRETLLKRYGEF